MIHKVSNASFDRCITLCLRKANRVLTNIYDQSLSKHGIKITQFSILSAVNYMGEATNRTLQDALILDQTTLSRGLKPLLRDNYLEIRTGEDRRQKHLRLTAEGKKLFKAAETSWSKTQQQLKDLLGSELTAQLFEVGDAIVELKG